MPLAEKLACGVLSLAACALLWTPSTYSCCAKDHHQGLTRAATRSGLLGGLDLFRVHVGRYPTTAEGINALLLPPADPRTAQRWKGPYVKSTNDLRDSWGNPFLYACPGLHNKDGYDLWSAGPNGVNDDGDSDDITNWK